MFPLAFPPMGCQNVLSVRPMKELISSAIFTELLSNDLAELTVRQSSHKESHAKGKASI